MSEKNTRGLKVRAKECGTIRRGGSYVCMHRGSSHTIPILERERNGLQRGASNRGNIQTQMIS